MDLTTPEIWAAITAIGTTLSATIGKLYLDNKDLRTELSQVRDKYQEKFEGLLTKVIELTSTSVNQTNTYTNSISTLTSSTANFQEKMSNLFTGLREEILRGKGNGQL